MKKHLILILATLFLAVFAAEAKTGKIKFGKYVYYEGEVVNKQPEGNGSFILVSPTDKKNVVATITGQFAGNKIINADITSKLLPTIKIGHNQFITYDLHGDKGKVNNLTFNFSKVSFNMGESEYTMDLKAHVSIANKKWEMTESSPYTFTLTTNAPAPDWMSKYWNNPLRVEVSAVVKNGYLFIEGQPSYIFNDYKYDSNTHNFVPVNGDLLFSFQIDKQFPIWIGKRKLEDGTIIESDGSENIVIKRSGAVYHGSLIDRMQPVKQEVKRFEDLQYKTGTLTKNNNMLDVSIKYLNGETEHDIRNRLKNQGINDDIIDSVIAEDISESEAMTKQREREAEIKKREEAKARLEAENKELADIIKSKWNCEQVGFSGPIYGTKEGDEVFRMILNLDHTYFSGKVMLGLQADGKGVLVVVVEPSEKINRMSRPRAMQVYDACEKLNKTINGRWKLDGNDVLINGEKVATLSKDGKTAKYEGMIGSTMKIIKKK